LERIPNFRQGKSRKEAPSLCSKQSAQLPGQINKTRCLLETSTFFEKTASERGWQGEKSEKEKNRLGKRLERRKIREGKKPPRKEAGKEKNPRRKKPPRKMAGNEKNKKP
jgi:hypothetical protein